MAQPASKKKTLVKGRHLSAIKRQRQEKKRTALNTSRKSALRTQTKKVLEAVSKKDAKVATEGLKLVVSLLQKAGQRNLLHRKTVSRYVGRLTRKVDAIRS